jgi:hypothetical protein
MNCREGLEELATGSLRELSPDSPVSHHAASCPDCGPLLTQLRDREYNAATILNNLPPLSNPIAVAETAGRLSRRRRVGGVVVTLTAIALGISIWFAVHTMLPNFNRAIGDVSTLRTETIPLSCLSPEQAGEIISPYVRSHGSTYYTPPPGVAAITVRATESELGQVHDLLRNFDNSLNTSCQTAGRASGGGLGEALKGLEDLQRLKSLEDLQQLQPVLAGENPKPRPKLTRPSPAADPQQP